MGWGKDKEKGHEIEEKEQRENEVGENEAEKMGEVRKKVKRKWHSITELKRKDVKKNK